MSYYRHKFTIFITIFENNDWRKMSVLFEYFTLLFFFKLKTSG